MKKQYLLVDIGQNVFLVFGSKKEGYNSNVVFSAVVTEVRIRNDGVTYFCELLKCVTDRNENIEKYTKFFMFRNSNIDTGYRGDSWNRCYPVFTTKEGCLEWLRN